MKVLVSPSIPYDTSGWRVEREGFNVKRLKNPLDEHHLNTYDAIVNLGHHNWPVHNNIWNPSSVVRLANTLHEYDEFMEGLVPPFPKIGEPFWVKHPGQQGNGKQYYPEFTEELASLYSNIHAGIQRHVDGEEFRLITVGDYVVQAARKIPDPLPDGTSKVGVFEWQWIGTKGCNNFPGLIPKAKAAASRFVEAFGTYQIILGHDIIYQPSGECFLIESNTAPGMNEATAGRVLKQMKQYWSITDVM